MVFTLWVQNVASIDYLVAFLVAKLSAPNNVLVHLMWTRLRVTNSS